VQYICIYIRYIGDQGHKNIHTNNPTKYSGTICELSDHKETSWAFSCDFTVFNSCPNRFLFACFI